MEGVIKSIPEERGCIFLEKGVLDSVVKNYKPLYASNHES